jgi:hypothetical protein
MKPIGNLATMACAPTRGQRCRCTLGEDAARATGRNLEFRDRGNHRRERQEVASVRRQAEGHDYLHGGRSFFAGSCRGRPAEDRIEQSPRRHRWRSSPERLPSSEPIQSMRPRGGQHVPERRRHGSDPDDRPSHPRRIPQHQSSCLARWPGHRDEHLSARKMTITAVHRKSAVHAG